MKDEEIIKKVMKSKDYPLTSELLRRALSLQRKELEKKIKLLKEKICVVMGMDKEVSYYWHDVEHEINEVFKDG